MKQLDHIGYYMKDFKMILDSFKPGVQGNTRGQPATILEEDSDESN